MLRVFCGIRHVVHARRPVVSCLYGRSDAVPARGGQRLSLNGSASSRVARAPPGRSPPFFIAARRMTARRGQVGVRRSSPESWLSVVVRHAGSGAGRRDDHRHVPRLVQHTKYTARYCAGCSGWLTHPLLPRGPVDRRVVRPRLADVRPQTLLVSAR